MMKAPRLRRSSVHLFAFAAAVAICWLLGPVDPAIAYDPVNGDFAKANPAQIRIASYNTQGEFIANAGKDAAFARVLTALNPDIIVFEEIPNTIADAVLAARLDSLLPTAGGWQVHAGLDTSIHTVVASRFPLLLTRTDTIPSSSTRGVTIALADLPDASYTNDLYLLGLHLKAFNDSSSQTKRRISADAIANWLGDARGEARPSGDNVTLAADTPMIVLGDLNLVGGPLSPPLPIDTLLTGNIFDEATYGPDVQGDWDISNMTDQTPTDPNTGDADTWPSNTTNPTSRLDRFIHTDSATAVANSFVLNTLNLSGTALANAGLNANDTTSASTADHLPIVMDLDMTPDCNANGIPDATDINCGGLIISEIMDGTLTGGTPKYVEITNAAAVDFVFLEGGLIIQSNFDTGLAIDVNLTGVMIPAGDSFVIVSNQQSGDTQFVTVFGFAADLVSGVPFANGNDRYMITTTADSSIIVDSYGENGVDGIGTPWEYTNSFAFRLPAFNVGVGLGFDAAQWSIAGPNALDGVGAAGILAAGTPGVHDSGLACGSADCNANGILDECEIDAGSAAPGGPFFCTMNCTPDFNNNGVPDGCDVIGDFDGDGMITLGDVQVFVDSLVSGGATPLGDFNGDGTFDGLDIDDFVQCILGGPCP